MGYIIYALMAVILGQIVSHLNLKMPPVVSEEISYKDFFNSLKSDFKVDIKYSIILIIIFEAIGYKFGNMYMSYIYFFLVATLMIVFSIDYRFQLIPDEAHLVIILLGIINLIINLKLWYTYILGAIIGGLIFYSLSFVSVLIFKKEGMGFGDVKLMAALGFLFGMKNILIITLVSFFLGAIVGSILLILNRKRVDSYIPFGPFIVISAILLIFVDANDIFALYIGLCSWLSIAITDIIYKFIN